MSAATDLFALDLDRLKAGASTITRGRTITEADLTQFSALTGDWHRQHSDAVWAEESVFGERIAHGMLLLSYAVGLMPLDDERVVALRGIRNVVFKRPAPIGTTIYAGVELLETKPLDDGHGLVSLRLDVRDGEDKLLARGTIDAVWKRGGAEAARNGSGAEAAAKSANDASPRQSLARAADDGLAPVLDGRVCI